VHVPRTSGPHPGWSKRHIPCGRQSAALRQPEAGTTGPLDGPWSVGGDEVAGDPDGAGATAFPEARASQPAASPASPAARTRAHRKKELRSRGTERYYTARATPMTAVTRRTSGARAREAHVQLVHACHAVAWSEARRVAAAIQRQVREHFGPVYGIDATVEAVPAGKQHPRAWQVAVVDDAASADDQGWHELTAAGLPLGKVLAKRALADRGGWSSAASHEVLEMLADPDMSLTVLVHGERRSHLYTYEICDPVQDDRWGYSVDRVRVSDFLYPAWFESFRARGSTRFDHTGGCDRPLQVLAGGYATVTHANWEHGWRDEGPPRGKAGTSRGSRRARLDLPRGKWRKSRGRAGR
jgi:hypothetical protein